MSVEGFLDANILVYAASISLEERRKRDIALAFVTSGVAGLSAQVLQEFYVVATRKTLQPLSLDAASSWVDRLSDLPCASIDSNLVRSAIGLSFRYQISYWDAAIVAAAETLGASVLYTEDLNHGQFYGRVRVWNPFLGSIRPETGLQ